MYTISFLNFNNLLISFLYISKVVPIFFFFSKFCLHFFVSTNYQILCFPINFFIIVSSWSRKPNPEVVISLFRRPRIIGIIIAIVAGSIPAEKRTSFNSNLNL